MKKLICLLHHSLRLTKTTDCEIEEFENGNRKINVYKCKHCGEDIVVVTEYVKAKPCKPFSSNLKDFSCENYVNGYCNLDNKICYVKQSKRRDEAHFDCGEKASK